MVYWLRIEGYGCEIDYQTVDRHGAYSGAVEVRPFQAKKDPSGA
jgi:hypothetical protein